MPYPKALIFDMDGTLVDNMEYHKQSWIDLFEYHKLNLDYTTFDTQYHNGSLVEIMARLFPHVKNKDELYQIGSYKEVLYRDLYRSHVKAIQGLHPFLESQRKKKHTYGDCNYG
jgi:beta-phosphoglucomutase-like phosphatase (HAD superfamily)